MGAAVGGVPEWLLDGEHGYLVPPGEALTLAAAADRLAVDPGEARRMGQAGRQWVAQNLGQEDLMQSLEHLYGRALAGEAA